MTMKWEMEQAKSLKGWTGCKAGPMLSGHKLAQEVFGRPDELHPEKTDNTGLTAFAYLWRRFGPPTFGSDSHKDLCSYFLTTEHPEVVLWITPSGSGVAYAVGYMVTNKLEEKNNAEMFSDIWAWDKKFEKWWIKRNAAKFPILKSEKTYKAASDEDKQKVAEAFNNARYGDYTAASGWKPDAEFKLAQKAIGKYPRRKDDDTKTGKLVRKVIKNALAELLRPVYIRDVPINILGRCDHSDAPSAEYSKYAGLGISLKPLDALLAKEAE
jgi:hypothetical protein